MRAAPIASLAGLLVACSVGAGQADSLALAQISAASATAIVLPLRESEAALAGAKRIAARTSLEDFAGVDTAALRNRVEQRLRDAGISLDPTAAAALLLRCFALPGKTGPVAYTCSIDFSDVVAHGIPTTGHYQAILWGAPPTIGMAGREHLAQGVTQIVDDQVGSFLKAWSKVNPR